MTSEQIRKLFFDFFKKKGHSIAPSSSLIPDDPSVLLTTAGMQQFKRYFTGELDALKDFNSQRTVSIQKCFRTSDIDEVGDKTHLTFFEMLGNFSFGKKPDGYFKQQAIFWAWEFITETLNINTERITVSVFNGDKETPFDGESYKIWHKEIGLPENKIISGNRTDNFWGPTGDEGPCGPTTELYIAAPKGGEPRPDGRDGIEVWNLVFNEYYKERSGKFIKVENPGVDTGMGMERLAAILQGTDDVFETDIFQPLISKINELTPNLDIRVVRVLADHLRACVFLTADGIMPSNKEAGYVLRRLLRRILSYQIKYDIHADLLPESVEIIKEKFAEIYPELKESAKILNILEDERLKFQEAIGQGIKKIDELNLGNVQLTGQLAFDLYQTYGLPLEISRELAKNKADDFKDDFDKEFEKHQEISRAGAEKKFGGHGLALDTGELKAGSQEEIKKVIRLHTATHLLHYALRKVLGKEIQQMGSDINPERTRFDFSFNRKMTVDEIKKVEDLVNQKIKENLPVYFKEMPKEEAEKTEALHFFKQKYPALVKVYFIGSEASGGVISAEFCGGPHVDYTSQIKSVKILKEESVGAGIRRIRAKIE
ncbi:MAG: alanine--tRNA ligase [Patescibacteria group bacterium]